MLTSCQATLLNSLIYKNFFIDSLISPLLWLLYGILPNSSCLRSTTFFHGSICFSLLKYQLFLVFSCEFLFIPQTQLMFPICQTFLDCYTGFSSYELQLYHLHTCTRRVIKLYSNFACIYQSFWGRRTGLAVAVFTSPVFSWICYMIVSYRINVCWIDEQSNLID